jgi:hypothetical protein
MVSVLLISYLVSPGWKGKPGLRYLDERHILDLEVMVAGATLQREIGWFTRAVGVLLTIQGLEVEGLGIIAVDILNITANCDILVEPEALSTTVGTDGQVILGLIHGLPP